MGTKPHRWAAGAAALTAGLLAALPFAPPAGAVNWRVALSGEEGSVVRISTSTNFLGIEEVIGSGFFTHGVIVTCYHVIENAHYHIDVWFQGQEDPLYAYQVYTDPAQDLALLALDTGYDPGDLPLAGGRQRAGEPVAVAGHPNGVMRLVVKGARLLATNGSWWVQGYGHLRNMLLLEGSIIPGDSGGPVFNRYGQVIGVTEDSTASGRLGGAVPVAWVKRLLAKAGY